MNKVMALAALVLAVVAAPMAFAAESLQIISPHPQVIQDEFGPAFEKYYKAQTGKDVKVVWRDMGGTSDDLRWITSEFAKRPDGVGIDLFFGGGIDPYGKLKEAGVLAEYVVPDSILSGIPGDLSGVRLYDADHRWYGTVLSGFGIVYNKVLMKRLGIEAPGSWEDLADPRLYSWVGSGDPRHSGSVHMSYEIILQAYGWDRGWQIITAMAGNTRNFVQNAGDVPRGVGKGTIAAGMCIDFYALDQIAQVGPDQVGFCLPEGLTVNNPDSIAILKGAPNMAAAKMFVDFVLSDQGQKIWYLKPGAPGGPVKNGLFRMPIKPSIYDAYAKDSLVTMNPFKWGKGFDYDSARGSARWEALNDLLGATVIDSHRSLVDAWKRAIGTGRTGALLAQLAKPPVAEAELNEINAKLKDPVFRNKVLADWVASARARYEAVR